MKALVYLEHHGSELARGSLGVLSEAARLAAGSGEGVAAVLLGGTEVRALAEQAVRSGASTVLLAVGDRLVSPLPQPRVAALAQIVESGSYDTVLFSNSVLASDIAAGLAARLDAGLNWDLSGLALRDGEPVGTRLALGDSVLVEAGWRSPRRVAVFRSGSFDPHAVEVGASEIAELEVAIEQRSMRASIVEQHDLSARGPSLADADVVVAGGIGLGGAEAFALAEELASALGGVVGATRAAVYAGWYPASAQIGQTGTTVAPKLYVALGISGAVQHKVGMQRSATIVAVNTDPNAPIFEFSDLAVVGDVQTIAPQLAELVRQHKSA